MPDDIILKILSYLPTVVAVKMSILSKRWRHIWVSDRGLYIQESMTLPPPPSRGEFERQKFIRLAKQCMRRKLKLLHSNIDRFKLCMRNLGRGHKFIDDWLTSIVRLAKVKDMHICVVQGSHYSNRRLLYSLQTH